MFVYFGYDLITVCLSFSFLANDFVSLIFYYEFECPSGIIRQTFKDLFIRISILEIKEKRNARKTEKNTYQFSDHILI